MAALQETIPLDYPDEATSGAVHRHDHEKLHAYANGIAELAEQFNLTEYTERYTLEYPLTVGGLFDVLATFINGAKALKAGLDA
jgi:hypothetical protein